MWTTQQELIFIDGLGDWREQGSHHHKALTAGEKVILLTGYRQGFLLRADWGDMDRHVLLDHVDTQLAAYKAMDPTKIV